jgi:excisionase family DNA binding protein
VTFTVCQVPIYNKRILARTSYTLKNAEGNEKTQADTRGRKMAQTAKAFEKLYLVNEAAELVRVSPWTIWAKLKNGELLRTKVGGRTVIRESELQKLIVDQPVAVR